MSWRDQDNGRWDAERYGYPSPPTCRESRKCEQERRDYQYGYDRRIEELAEERAIAKQRQERQWEEQREQDRYWEAEQERQRERQEERAYYNAMENAMEEAHLIWLDWQDSLYLLSFADG